MSDYLKSINGNECKFYRPIYVHPSSKVPEEFKNTNCGHACTLFTEKSILTGNDVRVDVVIGSKKCPGCEMFTKAVGSSDEQELSVNSDDEKEIKRIFGMALSYKRKQFNNEYPRDRSTKNVLRREVMHLCHVMLPDYPDDVLTCVISKLMGQL